MRICYTHICILYMCRNVITLCLGFTLNCHSINLVISSLLLYSFSRLLVHLLHKTDHSFNFIDQSKFFFMFTLLKTELQTNRWSENEQRQKKCFPETCGTMNWSSRSSYMQSEKSWKDINDWYQIYTNACQDVRNVPKYLLLEAQRTEWYNTDSSYCKKLSSSLPA